MNDIAKTKRRDNAQFDHEGKFDLAETIEENRIRATEFEAPKERKFKARNMITMHFNYMTYPCPSPYAMAQIFAAVIDHANINTGRCDASQRTIAIETNFHRNTVKKWLDWIAANTPYLTIEQRRGKLGKFRTSAYHISWANLEADWRAVQEVVKSKKAEAREE